jgi:hypothetical protein
MATTGHRHFRVAGQPGAIRTITPPSLRQTSQWTPCHILGQSFETLEGLILEPSEFVPKLTLLETCVTVLGGNLC